MSCRSVKAALSVLWLGMITAAGCASDAPGREQASAPSPSSLAGTRWVLVEFQSMDDAIGSERPRETARYTMAFADDGRVAMQLDCNRANGSWTAQPDGDGGALTFSPLAMTRMRCPEPSMDAKIARDAEYVRSYRLQGDRLYLSLMADGGIYVWQRAAE